jgi:hypothetical protein
LQDVEEAMVGYLSGDEREGEKGERERGGKEGEKDAEEKEEGRKGGKEGWGRRER